MNLSEEQIRRILACSGFELAAGLADPRPETHPIACTCEACSRHIHICDCDDCLNGKAPT